jgi:hypothetical protein
MDYSVRSRVTFTCRLSQLLSARVPVTYRQPPDMGLTAAPQIESVVLDGKTASVGAQSVV